MDDESAQLAEMLTKLAIERVAMFGGLLIEKRRRKKLEEQEKDRLRKEAKEWPLERSIAIVPWIDTGLHDNVTGDCDLSSTLQDNGHLSFYLSFLWLAPFPAEHVKASFQCAITVPHDGTSKTREITYTVKDYRITGNRLPAQLRGAFKALIEIDPDVPICDTDLGPKSPAKDLHVKIGRDVSLRNMTLTANGPWPGVTESIELPVMGFWVPRY